MNKLKTIFFGTGNYANMIMEALPLARAQRKIFLDTVLARNVTRLGAFKEKFGFLGYAGIGAFEKKLAEEADLKFIVTPAPMHAQMLRQVANTKAIWCEKPLALSYEEAKLVGEEINILQDKVFVDYTYNNDPLFIKLAKLVRAGQLGKINEVHAHFLRRDFIDVAEPWRPDQGYRRASLDLLPHLLAGFDLMGFEVTAVRNIDLLDPGKFHQMPWSDGGSVELKLVNKSGAEIDTKVEISMARSGGHDNGFEVYSEKGKYFWVYEVTSPEKGYGQSWLKHDPQLTTDGSQAHSNYPAVERGFTRLQMLAMQWDRVIKLASGRQLQPTDPCSFKRALEHQRIVGLVEAATRCRNWLSVK